MKMIHLDLETYSSYDLSKCGVYKYTEAPDFEILLFGYSVDGGPVKVVDLAMGEEIPEEILEALTDEQVIKWAHNAQFERICLSRFLRDRGLSLSAVPFGDEEKESAKYLNPEGWHCTMTWAAYMGLPLSLMGAGIVLGLDKKKMEEGKELIRFFCVPRKPTKTNPATRNRPEDAPDKWAVFKEYNIRDVEVEMEIAEKLERFPVPDFVWDEYCIDQEINDRGVALDMELVRAAIEMDGEIRDELKGRMQEITEVENPNSVQQLTSWLGDNGLEVDSLGKKDVKKLVGSTEGDVKEVLQLRQQLAKSSVKKYQAMENAVCADGRARGMFQFYGANRTGRFCLTGDHEVLTDEGWRRLDEWNGGRIAVWNKDTEAVSFQESKQVSFDYEGDMYTYQDSRIDQCSTPDHKMRAQRRYGSEWIDMTVEEMAGCRPVIPTTGYRYSRNCADENWFRVLIMTQADGFYTTDGSIRYNFKKQRKVERCKMLLRRAEIPFVVHQFKESTNISIPARKVPLWLREFRTKTFGFWLLDENPDIFFDELPYWDGYHPAPNSIQYVTTNKQNADIVQALAHMSGRTCSVKLKHRPDHPEWHDAYYLNIWLTPGNAHELRVKPIIEKYQGKVYCAVTPTGYFLVRRNGKVWVTGNSGRLVQLQNLPQNHLPDLAEARALVRSGDIDAVKMLYEDVPDTLSQLIRTAFVPKKDNLFYVADFSAIEARVLSWLAGEEWRMEVFEQGGDIYCATASRMFGVPVEKHGVNSDLRQKGKQAELACIAEGSLVLTDQGLVPIENVTLEQKLWDGENWVSHEGVIYKGEREVIEYEGLTATPDHLVWIERESKPVQFGYAASSGAHLIQTGDGGRTIRLGENYQRGKEMEQELESLLCPDGMPGVRSDSVATAGQPEVRKVERMPDLLTAKADSPLAGSEINICETEMRKSKGSRVCKLRWPWNKIFLSKRDCSRSVSDREVWNSGQGDGTGQNRYERGLCAGQSAVCYQEGEYGKSKKHDSFRVLSGVLAILRKYCGEKIGIWNDTGTDHPGCGDGSIREKKELANNQRKARLYDIRNAGSNHRFTVSGRLVHNCGYGGGVGAMIAMGAVDMGIPEEELDGIVKAWRSASPNIVRLWWDVDRAAKVAIKEKTTTTSHGLKFSYQSGFLFITLPSGRNLAYVKPRMGENKFGGESITYEGVGATKKWERLETYGPKIIENVVQGLSRDILMYAMKTLRHCNICMHIHDELVIEASPKVSLEVLCEQMGRTPPWTPGLVLRADGYVTPFYKKD